MSYDKISANYDRVLAPFENWFLDKWRAETLSYLPENAKILEIGAGTGLNFKHYPNYQKAVAGDISIKMLEVAKQKTNSVNLIQADAEELPFPDDSFDTVFATLVFCSIPKPKKAFAELQRVLKEKGKIILLEHVRPNGLLGLLFDVLNVLTVALFADCFNRKTSEIAEESGFKIIKLKPKAFGIVNLIICEVENTAKK
jgi:ubiquinone/menaquinone biosynthesis C-methylase UbiE